MNVVAMLIWAVIILAAVAFTLYLMWSDAKKELGECWEKRSEYLSLWLKSPSAGVLDLYKKRAERYQGYWNDACETNSQLAKELQIHKDMLEVERKEAVSDKQTISDLRADLVKARQLSDHYKRSFFCSSGRLAEVLVELYSLRSKRKSSTGSVKKRTK